MLIRWDEMMWLHDSEVGVSGYKFAEGAMSFGGILNVALLLSVKFQGLNSEP